MHEVVAGLGRFGRRRAVGSTPKAFGVGAVALFPSTHAAALVGSPASPLSRCDALPRIRGRSGLPNRRHNELPFRRGLGYTLPRRNARRFADGPADMRWTSVPAASNVRCADWRM
jgi:hypothetical protein